MSLPILNSPPAPAAGAAAHARTQPAETETHQGFAHVLGRARSSSTGSGAPEGDARPTAATDSATPVLAEAADASEVAEATDTLTVVDAHGSALADMVHDLTRRSRAVASGQAETTDPHLGDRRLARLASLPSTADAPQTSAALTGNPTAATAHQHTVGAPAAAAGLAETAATLRTAHATTSQLPASHPAGATDTSDVATAALSRWLGAPDDTNADLEPATTPLPAELPQMAAVALAAAPAEASRPHGASLGTPSYGALTSASARAQSTAQRSWAVRPGDAAGHEPGKAPLLAETQDGAARALPAGLQASATTAAATTETPFAPAAGAGAIATPPDGAAHLAGRSPHVLNGSVATPVGTPQWGAALGEQLITLGRSDDGVIRHAELRLDPPHLGPLRVTLQLHGEQASAVFVSAQPAVRAALEAAMPQLQQTLADAGISLGHTSVGEQQTPDAQVEERFGGARDEDRVAEPALAAASTPVVRAPRGLIDTFA